MTARRLTLGMLVALTCLVVFGTSEASAAVTHAFLSGVSKKLNESVPAQGPHGEAVAVPGPFNELQSVTVDSGELYVAEGQQTSRIDKFDAASGAFVSQFPQIASPTFLHQGVTVGHSTGEAQIYVAGDTEGPTKGAVAALNATGGLLGVWSGTDVPVEGHTPSPGFGCFECYGPGDMAVDESGSLSWAAGDVYVADPTHGVVDVFKPKVGGGEEYVAQLTGPGQPPPGPGVFSKPVGVAVNQSNDELVVLDGGRNTVDIFAPTAIVGQYEFVREVAGPPPTGIFGAVGSLAVDGGKGDIYVSEIKNDEGTSHSIVDEFTSAGEYIGHLLGTPSGSFTEVKSVAVDPNSHDLYVADRLEAETGNGAHGLMDVFGRDIVLPDVFTEAASGLTPFSVTLNGRVNPESEGEASCRFVWGTTPQFGQVASCEPEGVPNGSSPIEVHAKLNLRPDTTYYYRLQATNKNGTNPGEPVQGRQFTTPGPGMQESVSEVASGSATLDATINPHGAPTSYYFQYGKSSAYETDVPLAPGASLGAGEGGIEVSRHIQKLDPNSVYHYRVVAVSEVESGRPEEFDGPDQTFTTQAGGSALVLADGRQWEQVSPVDKHGASILPINERGVIQAAASGGAIAYSALSPTENGSPGFEEWPQVFSTRGSVGWSSQDIALPHASPPGPATGNGTEYRFFSEDLSLGLAESQGEFTSLSPNVSPPDTERTPYVRHDLTCQSSPSTCFVPLVTSAPGFADVPPGTEFGGDPNQTFGGAVQFVAATPSMSHVLLSSPVALTETQVNGALYEWSAGSPSSSALQLVSLLPAAEGGTAVSGQVGYSFGAGSVGAPNARGAVSSDGSRIVWFDAANGGLYLRDMSKGQTVRLDAVQGGSGAGKGVAHFQIANGDGSVVFFTQARQLTADSGARGDGTANSSVSDLYECEIAEVAGALQCRLSDLTPVRGGESANVQGGVLGASVDGSYVYFVATGVLSDVENGRHQRAIAGAENLYELHRGVGGWEAPVFIGTLSGDDKPDWSEIEAIQTARVSPNGRFLAFMSDRSLTGYENRDAKSGNPDEEVFVFDGQSDRLACASCDPTGARPVGVEYAQLNGNLVGGDRVWESSQWIAANIPGWTPYQTSRAQYQSRFLSDDGRLFFNSSDALVSRDINGNEDVYEYEPPGVGDCSSTGVTFDVRSGGCVSLISSGAASGESAFMDASQDGGDVFFLTGEKLVSGDFDTSFDLYDAHVCSSRAPCYSSPVASPACTTADACRSAPSPQPPIFGSPSSATFAGAGNVSQPGVGSAVVRSKSLTRSQKLARALAACHKKKSRSRHAACVRQARKRFAARRARGGNVSKNGKG